MNDRVFFDTNVLLYLLSGNAARANRAEALIAGGGVVSVQVLNEFASVTSKKLHMTGLKLENCTLASGHRAKWCR